MSEKQFDPGKHLIKIQGRDYLQVRDRLLWLRSDHPEAKVETCIEALSDNAATVRATITLPSGAVGSGLARETLDAVKNLGGAYVEKAETAAVGRALAHLGYGTQFAIELDEGHLADSPVERSSGGHLAQAARDAGFQDVPRTSSTGGTNGNGNAAFRERLGAPPPSTGGYAPKGASDKQIGAIKAIARGRKVDEAALTSHMLTMWNTADLESLTSRQASDLIGWLQQQEEQ